MANAASFRSWSRLGHGPGAFPITTISTCATTDRHNSYKARRIPKNEAVGKWAQIPDDAIKWTSEARRRVLRMLGLGTNLGRRTHQRSIPVDRMANKGCRIMHKEGSEQRLLQQTSLTTVCEAGRSCLAVHLSRLIQFLWGSESVWRRYTALLMSIQDRTRSRAPALSGLLAVPENGPERFVTYIVTAIISSSSQ